MILQDLHITPRQEAAVLTTGLLVVLFLGILASIGVVVAALWLLVQVVTLLLTSVIEALDSLGALYQAADPMIRFFLLVAIGFLAWRIIRRYIPASWRKSL